ncbi:uncharacterized protein LOC105425173 isoform X1 [Pogonomyrmex barbatus]|uniref:Uncharacterized protein LOC105425173 isoform X1 n=1 Tax=Pogonomyrmex barbatus TaxID=144034 RepID=A0A6I9VZW5_9HYME|nr:uncharacterized protein LOC105425173 isoform X1 [Pogonomyrmex barbatus]XP_011634109.1 uncharacterized protein LOC105425173 isoform X1 [Pogonomyrmex barbatus]XP_011634110.1 uncharacterized protein LOC105425173 isoform X1 [Pogonomyrmex barbatus]
MMAENNAEDTKSVENETPSETLSVISINDEAGPSNKEENSEVPDSDKLTSKENPNKKEDASAEEEKAEGTDLLDSEKKGQDASKTDCNGDSTEKINLDKTASSETIESGTKENNFIESPASPTGEEDTNENDSLNDILKIVHGDLAKEMIQAVNESATAKDDSDEDSDEDSIKKKQQTVKKKDDISGGGTSDSMKECISTIVAKYAKDKQVSKEFSERIEKKLSFGFVDPPIVIGQLIEEQLANESALSADRTDHIVEWVKNSVKVNVDEDGNTTEERKLGTYERDTTDETRKRRKPTDSISPHAVSPRKSQKFVTNIIKRSIKCLNKMHAMEGAAENKRKVDVAENRADDKTSSRSSPSPKVPQSQQNGAALPEETAAAPTTTVSARPRIKKKDESDCDNETSDTRDRQLLAGTSRQNATAPSKNVQPRHVKAASEPIDIKKRKSTNGQLISLGNPRKKFREDFSREEYLLSIVGDNNESVEDLMAKADQLRADILALENLAHAKEMEWNEILRKRKLKEEAYLRLERKIQTTTYMENDSQLPEASPSVKPSLGLAEWENSSSTISMKDKSFESKEDSGEKSLDSCLKKEKITRVSSQQRATPPKTNGESNRKQNETASPESRQIGEGRQGAIVDVRSIIADHRLKHPETVPRRGRRMRSSNVNINLGAGGAMVETGHNADSRPSSTESCKSNPSTNDSMNYKDMLVQFAKLSQQGEIVKTPQNYPDVTLHPVTPSSAQNTPQSSGSLLHGILTKAQTPRSTTFSPTLARLLTAPERERSSPTTAAAATASASMSQQSGTTQHLLQTYQGSNLVSINDLLSSSKARTEITITPVVNTPAQSHSNDLIQVEDIEEETTDDRKGNSIAGRDGKQIVKDNPPSPSAPPKCQGCRIRPAQFVCAGCGNQWYCSRSCQLAAWATHSDHCPPEPENSKTKLV